MTFKNSDYCINKINYKTNDLTKISIKYKTSTNRNFSDLSDREQKNSPETEEPEKLQL